MCVCVGGGGGGATTTVHVFVNARSCVSHSALTMIQLFQAHCTV